jgi:hypothetical protein
LPAEVASLLEAPSRVDPEAFALGQIYYDSDATIAGGWGVGWAATLTDDGRRAGVDGAPSPPYVRLCPLGRSLARLDWLAIAMLIKLQGVRLTMTRYAKPARICDIMTILVIQSVRPLLTHKVGI